MVAKRHELTSHSGNGYSRVGSILVPSILFPSSFSCAAAEALGIGIPQQSPHPSWTCPSCVHSLPVSEGGGGPSYGRTDPKRKCCKTGSFPSTSASYILIMPATTLPHVLTCGRKCNVRERGVMTIRDPQRWRSLAQATGS